MIGADPRRLCGRTAGSGWPFTTRRTSGSSGHGWRTYRWNQLRPGDLVVILPAGHACLAILPRRSGGHRKRPGPAPRLDRISQIAAYRCWGAGSGPGPRAKQPLNDYYRPRDVPPAGRQSPTPIAGTGRGGPDRAPWAPPRPSPRARPRPDPQRGHDSGRAGATRHPRKLKKRGRVANRRAGGSGRLDLRRAAKTRGGPHTTSSNRRPCRQTPQPPEHRDRPVNSQQATLGRRSGPNGPP